MSRSDYELRASVLSHFAADWITDDDPDDDELIDFLLGSCDRVDGPDGEGFWRLGGRERAQIWRTHDTGELARWSQQVSARPESGLQRAIDHALSGRPIALDDVDDDAVRSWWTIRQWVGDDSSSQLPAAEEIDAELQRRRITAPLRATLDDHVIGRTEMLGEVTSHVLRFSGEPLILHGVGGVGKSTVLASLLLRRLPPDVSFAYLNFDRGTLTAGRPHQLLDEVVRQIAELTPGIDRIAVDDWRRRLRQESKSSLGISSASSEIQLQQGVPRDLIAELAKIDGFRGRGLVIALDTYEEVQRRAPADSFLVWDLMRDLSSIMGSWSVVAAGRAPIPESGGESIHVAELAPGDARLLLVDLLDERRHGVVDRLLDLVGRNPLSLRLAAEAVNRTEIDDPMQLLDVVDGNVQGQLYARILDHIANEEVRKIAHPGLVVRRLTPDLIKPVLAGPCELDLEQSSPTELLDALEAEATLVERAADGALVHRADVRALMLPALRRVQPAKVERIHELAVAYYTTRDDSSAATEELYHRLMLGQQVTVVPPGADIDSLISSIDELPAAGQMWLGTIRPGLSLSDETLSEANDENWAQLTVAEARSALRAGRPQVALDLVRQRTGPGGRSLLPNEEIQALEQLGSVDRAADIAARALDDARASGDMAATRDLTRHVARLTERLGRHDEAVETIRTLVDVYLRSGVPREPDRAVEELIDLATLLRLNRHDRRRSNMDHVARVEAYASDLLEVLPDRALVRRPSLLRDLAAELGTDHERVVRLALEAVGVEDEAPGSSLDAAAPGATPTDGFDGPDVQDGDARWAAPPSTGSATRTRVKDTAQVSPEVLAGAVAAYQDEADRSVGYSRFRVWKREHEEYRLTLAETDEAGRFRLNERFSYRDRNHDQPFVVPRLIDEFTTDLTSLPRRFLALDPGTHYARPAVLLQALTTENYSGPRVDSVEAGRVYRDALKELGMSGMRRYAVWTGLDWLTALRGRRGVRSAIHYWLVLLGTLAFSIWTWYSSYRTFVLSADNDVGSGNPWWVFGALIGMFAIPVSVGGLLAPTFGRRWRSGAIGSAFATALGGPGLLLLALLAVYVRIPLWFWRRGRGLLRRNR